MDLYLAVLSDSLGERAVPLPVGRRLALGRASDQDVVLYCNSVSRRHCEVGRDETGAWVLDLNTRNGTSLNGAPVPAQGRTPLGPGDLLQIADGFVAVAAADPAWRAWNDGTVRKMAQVIYDDRAFDRLPLLADALEDAGCRHAELLAHCRGLGRCYRCAGKGRFRFDGTLPARGARADGWESCWRCGGSGWQPATRHRGGCWALELLLGKS